MFFSQDFGFFSSSAGRLQRKVFFQDFYRLSINFLAYNLAKPLFWLDSRHLSVQIRVGDASFRLKNVPFMTNFMLKFTVLRPFLVYDILLLLLLYMDF